MTAAAALSNKAGALLGQDPSICPTDQEAKFHRPADAEHRSIAGRQKTVDKRSWDYIVRSGLAGGVAGCAVSGL